LLFAPVRSGKVMVINQQSRLVQKVKNLIV